MIDEAILAWMLLFAAAAPASAQQVSIGVWSPNVSIGVNLPLYPELVPVPGYPVYYAPRLDSNYFFYDGMYWVYEEDRWYASSWYNGPWGLVDPGFVPVYVLRVPVRYYRQPPAYFRGWRSDAPPRWGDHWGNQWAQRHQGWDRWDRNAVPARPPLPVYQRKYSGDRYPRAEQQQVLQDRNYQYQPRDNAMRQRYQAQRVQTPPALIQREARQIPAERNVDPHQRQQSEQKSVERERQTSRAAHQDARQGNEATRDTSRGRGQEKGREKNDDPGHGHGR